MARTFTLVGCNDFSIIKSGFIDEDTISEIEGLIEEVCKTPYNQIVNVEVFYMAFLDFENAPIEPATEEEIGILDEKLGVLLEEGYIEIIDTITVPVQGTMEIEEDIVAMIDM